MTNPTPVAWISNNGSLAYSKDSFMPSIRELSKPLFTEAHLNQARAAALREAADKMPVVGAHTWLRRMAAEIEGEKK